MTKNLYDVLGVAKDADCATIRRAYRRRSKDVHPDAGGSDAEFALVKLAADVLTNAERRAKYDATGDAGETTPDNALGNALQRLSCALDEVLQECEARGRRAHQVDVVAEMRMKLAARKAKVAEQARQVREGIRINETLAGRFAAKAGAEVMNGLIAGRIAQLRGFVANNEREIEALDAAWELLDRHTFRADPAGVTNRDLASQLNPMFAQLMFNQGMR